MMALVRVTAMNSGQVAARDKFGEGVPLWDYVLYEEWRGIFRRIRWASLSLALLSLATYAAWHVATRLSPRFNLAAQRLFAAAAGYRAPLRLALVPVWPEKETGDAVGAPRQALAALLTARRGAFKSD